jgi:hypothetical protein
MAGEQAWRDAKGKQIEVLLGLSASRPTFRQDVPLPTMPQSGLPLERRAMPMNTTPAFSMSRWFSDALQELVNYSDRLNTTEWAIISASAVIFGFLCLRGTSYRN